MVPEVLNNKYENDTMNQKGNMKMNIQKLLNTNRLSNVKQ